MLHILWMLIKWILILLGILLGLALVLALLILFCPVCYRAAAAKEGVPLWEARAEGRVSWLFGGISFIYRQTGQKGTFDVRLFGIPVLKLYEKFKSRKTKGSSEKTKAAFEGGEESEGVLEDSCENREEQTSFTEKESAGKDSSETDFQKESGKDQAQEFSSEKKNKPALFWEKLRGVFQKLRNIPKVLHKIPLTIRKICDKIEEWKAFINHPRVKAGAAFFKDRGMKLLHHIFPKKLKGRVVFGSEDPSLTGAVLALLGMTMPLHRNRVEIQPIFENRNFLEGNIMLRGRIYMIVPAVILLQLYFNKNIKYIISRWKHKEV